MTPQNRPAKIGSGEPTSNGIERNIQLICDIDRRQREFVAEALSLNSQFVARGTNELLWQDKALPSEPLVMRRDQRVGPTSLRPQLVSAVGRPRRITRGSNQSRAASFDTKRKTPPGRVDPGGVSRSSPGSTG